MNKNFKKEICSIQKSSDEEIKKARRVIFFIGTLFIIAGIWGLSGDSSSRVIRGPVNLILAFLEPEKRMPFLYYFCIVAGFVLFVIAMLKPRIK